VPGQRRAVLEGAVHALAVERHHRVRGVAKKDRVPALVPVVQVQRAEAADRVAFEIGLELRDQRQRVREIACEQGARRGPVADRVEPRLPHRRPRLVGQEQGHGEGAFVVGQGDAHVAAARPDVQGVGFDPEAAIRRRRDLQFLVGVAERCVALAEVGTGGHGRAQRRTGAVRAEQGGEGVRVPAAVAVVDEARGPVIEIDRVQPPVEVQARTRGLGRVQQGDVELAAADRPDHLAVVPAVALQLLAAIGEMHHAPAHHHRLAQHRLGGPGLAQRVQAALGQRQVDRAPAGIAGHPRIATALEHVDLPAAPRQQRRQERAGEARADDGQGPVRGHAASRQPATVRAKRSTSAWVL
jgi:hypothetical protein